MGVGRDIVAVVAAHAPYWLHHAGYFQSSDGWFPHRKKQALDLRGQFHVLKKIVTLLLNCFGKHFPLFDIPLDDVNDEGEAQHRREVVEDPKRRVESSRGAKVMEQNTNHD